ncbi:hypothetical protein LWI28_020625 [Acer negundo]|uniref:Uncharacterized protein n=1 Tax=Acer negundo TaxID=4023 RepID=A0AAD5NUJ5_ACENE|nr:hypothetical protein LWI28_020625 [Acer negundo]
MGPLTSNYVLCCSREGNEGKLFELTGELTLTLSLFDWPTTILYTRKKRSSQRQVRSQEQTPGSSRRVVLSAYRKTDIEQATLALQMR